MKREETYCSQMNVFEICPVMAPDVQIWTRPITLAAVQVAKERPSLIAAHLQRERKPFVVGNREGETSIKEPLSSLQLPI